MGEISLAYRRLFLNGERYRKYKAVLWKVESKKRISSMVQVLLRCCTTFEVFHGYLAGRGTNPFQSPHGVLSNIQKWIVWGDTYADKARGFIGKGRLGGEQQAKGTQEDCSATWLTVSDFVVMGLVSGLPLANHSDSQPFLVAHALLSQDGCQREGFWELVRHVVSPSDLSWSLPVGGGLLFHVPYGPPVVKQLMQMVTWLDSAWPGWVVSISVLPQTVTLAKWIITIVEIKQSGTLGFSWPPDESHFYFME